MTAMPKTSRTSQTRRGSTEIALPNGSGRALVNATEAWFAATTECQREMMGFVSMRLEKDGEVAREMLACRNLADMAAIQSHWIEETLHDYSSEMSKLMIICTRSVNGGGGGKE